MREADILYQNGPFWVCRAEFGSGRFKQKSKGFVVNKDGVTHATRVASIGYPGDIGLEKAKAEADRRATEKVK